MDGLEFLALDPATRLGWRDKTGSGSEILWQEGRKGKPAKPAVPDSIYKSGPNKGKPKPGTPAVAAVPAIPSLPKKTRLVRFYAWLMDYLARHPNVVVVYETVDGFSRGVKSTKVGIELRAIIELCAQFTGHRVECVQVNDLKHFATGKTNADKPEIAKAAKRRFGYVTPEGEEDDFDAIDAWVTYEWAQKHVYADRTTSSKSESAEEASE